MRVQETFAVAIYLRFSFKKPLLFQARPQGTRAQGHKGPRRKSKGRGAIAVMFVSRKAQGAAVCILI